MEHIKHIMKKIYDHQMDGVIFHSQMADLYDFLHLKGFRKWQEAMIKEESDCTAETQHHFIKRHHALLPPYQKVYENNIIPESWYEHTSMDISKEDIVRETKRSLHEYLKWEKETVEMLNQVSKELIEHEAYSEYMDVREMSEHVAGEIHYIECLMIELESVGYDAVYIQKLQTRFCVEFDD